MKNQPDTAFFGKGSAVLLGFVACALIGLASTASANLVTNGDFETGNFTGWTNSGDTSFTGVDGNPHSGNFAAFFGPVTSNGFITQNLATTAGGLYNLTFWLQNADSFANNHFEVSWNGSIISSVNNAPASPYTQYTFAGLAAPTNSTPLQFGFFNPGAFFFLDDVSVEASGVPEGFSTLWLALPLVGMMGFARLLRRVET